MTQHIRKSIALTALAAASLTLIGCASTSNPTAKDKLLASTGEIEMSQEVGDYEVMKEKDRSYTMKFSRTMKATRMLKSLPGQAMDATLNSPRVVVADTVLGELYYPFDVATLDGEDKKALDEAAMWLNEHPTQGLVLSGHADPEGSAPYNQYLALDRAQNARDYLVNEHDISPERLQAITHGEDHLAMLTSSRDANRINRRVVIKTDPADAYGVNTPAYDPIEAFFAAL